MSPARNDRKPDAFYVGYLPLPDSMRTFVRMATLSAVLLALAAGLLLAFAQPASGDGSWDFDEAVFEGVLTREPYPMLHAEDPERPGSTRAWLLVGSGKTGVLPRAEAALEEASSRRVRVHGMPLRRRGQRALSLLDGDGAIEVLGDTVDPADAPARSQPTAAATFVGEIIDPKCWLGAMSPGSGLVHRACASLCIRGGIAPCFVGGPEGQEPRFYVMTDANGRPCHDEVADLAGVLRTLRGTTTTFGTVQLLHVEIQSIQPAPRGDR